MRGLQSLMPPGLPTSGKWPYIFAGRNLLAGLIFTIAMKTIFFFLLLMCAADTGRAQHKYNWSKYMDLPFKADSIPPPLFWGFERHLVQPISHSDAEIEIRIYGTFHTSIGSFIRVRYYPDSAVFERITGSTNSDRYNLPVSSDDSLLYANGGNYYDWKIEQLDIKVAPAVFLDSLLRRRLLNPPTFDELKALILKSHKDEIGEDTAYPKIQYSLSNVPRTVFHYEVKIGKRYLCRNLYAIRYDDEKANIATYESYSPYLNYINPLFNSPRVIAIRELKNDRVP